MATIATLPIQGVRVSTIEIDNPANPYTFETIARLREKYGLEAELYFVVGADSFEELHTWRRPDLILSSCNLIVAGRPGYVMTDPALAESLRPRAQSTSTGPEGADSLPASFSSSLRIVDMTGGRRREVESIDRRVAGLIYLTDFTWADVSSTEIRRRAARDQDIHGMVPVGVADYIRKYGLYKAARPVEIQ